MKHLLSVIILLFSFNFSMAQTKDETDVNNAVELLRKAMVDANKTALEKITHPKLSYGHSDGRIQNQGQFINGIVSGKSDFVTIELSDQTIAITGQTAIVRHTLNSKTNDDGKPGIVRLFVLLVWTKEGNQWKLVARQAIKIPQKQ